MDTPLGAIMKLRKTEFYVIKELSSELFLTHNELSFFPLGDRTKLFDNMSDAMLFLEKNNDRLVSVYLWDSLEKATGESRFEINLDEPTYRSLILDIHFKVVKVHLEEVHTEEDKII